ncbi:MAG: class I SAM-dependent methyltransferase [Candidatus Dormibacteraeota bacterium]|nr:class I SAM-dependent methyltransferase [Candidatus Dormibacteraeota bacterium]
MQATARRQKGHKGVGMEGPIARWYARLRGTESQIEEYRREALRLTAGLPDRARLLEVAPGPGYFAIEMARPGRVRVTGLDVSRTFVRLAAENARRAGVEVDFRNGDAADMPFQDASFDLVVCQAAFKNFARPDRALDEMHRVLRDGGMAVVQDMDHEASRAAIDEEVQHMHLGRVNALMTRFTLSMLRRRAYTRQRMEALATASAFGGCEIETAGIGMDVRLRRQAVT